LHHIHGILLGIINDLLTGVDLWRMDLDALCLIGCTTMSWRDLGGGLLLVVAGLWSLDKLLGLGRGTRGGSADILMML
jgi:hypothetical protein